MLQPSAASAPGLAGRPGLGRGPALLLVLVALALHLPRVAGPFTDGQHGNCGAMFGLMVRNAQALGWVETLGVPVLNPVPPGPDDPWVTYTHHPPGLPWAVELAALLPGSVESGARLVALLLTLAAALLLADIGARLAGRRAALAAGLTFLLMPAGLHHGLLVNYETAALPGLLLLTRALVLGLGSPVLAALVAGLGDWVALLPIGLVLRGVPARRWWSAALTGGLLVLAVFVHGRAFAPASHAETLGQALAATFLGPSFDAGAWLTRMGEHLTVLYGPVLLPALAGLVLVGRRHPPLRRILLVLLAVGLLNVVLFAHHATSHEHFSLVLAPWVALSAATVLFPRDTAARPGGLTAAALLVIVLLLGLWDARGRWPARRQTLNAERAQALAAVADDERLHLFPEGVPLVFLHAAARHAWAYPVADLEGARDAAAAYARRFVARPLPAVVVLDDQAPVPAWLQALGPGRVEGPFRVWDVPTDG